MKVALILCPSWTIESPSYTVGILSAILRRHGHIVRGFDLNIDIYRNCKDDKDIETWQMDEKGTVWYEEGHVLDFIKRHNDYIEKYITDVLDYGASIIGFTVYSTSRYFSYEIARRIKELDSTRIIIFGGSQCFKNCEGLDTLRRPYIDSVCFGEGDTAFPKMLEQIERNKGKVARCLGFSIKDRKGDIVDCGEERLVTDLNALPYADYSDFDLNKYTKKLLPIATSRGCLGHCTFCNEAPHWKRYRFRTAENIYQEMSFQLSRYPGIKEFWLNDSLINGNIKMLDKLCSLLIENRANITYGGQALIRQEMDHRLLAKMKDSGCVLISYGLESGSDTVLKCVRKTYDTKTAEKVIRDTCATGIKTIFNIVTGFPCEGEKEFNETADFIRRNLTYTKEIAVMPLLLLKGSYLYEHTEEGGIDSETKYDQLRWKTKDDRNNYEHRMERFRLLKDIIGGQLYTAHSEDNASRDSGTISFLPNLCIELSSGCNMKCYMCAHFSEPAVHGDSYTNGFMSQNVWDNIIESLKKQTQEIESITFYWLGESLMHPRFKEMLSQLLQLNMERKIFSNLFLNTNGTYFDSEVSNIILNYASFIQDRKDYENCYLNIHFSLETLDSVVFKRIKGVDPKVLDRILGNIDYLTKERHRRVLSLPSITFGAVILEDNAEETERFDRYWKGHVGQYGRKCETIFNTQYFKDRDAVFFRCLDDISGTVYSKIAKEKYTEIVSRFQSKSEGGREEAGPVLIQRKRLPCFQLWNMYMISKEGFVTPCCKDRFLELTIGDLNKESLAEVLYGKNIEEMRLDHIKGRFYKYRLCADCKDPPGGFLSEEEIKKYVRARYSEKEYPKVFNFSNKAHKAIKLLNICLVSREYPSETGWGGIGTYTYHLAHGLAERGHRVHVVSQGLNGGRSYKDGDVNIHRIKHENYFYNKLFLTEFTLRLEYNQVVNRKIRELINNYDIDIIEGPNLSAETFIYSLRKKVPLVTRLHTNFSEVLNFAGQAKTMDNRLSCWLEDINIHRSDLIICSTKAHAKKIASRTGIDSDSIRIIPLGVNIPEAFELECQDVRPYRILFVGRIEERKGPQVLIRAIPLILDAVPDVEFIFIGRDTFASGNGTNIIQHNGTSFKDYLINTMPEYCRSKVKFLGYVDDDTLSGYFKTCTVFVAPSLYESFGFIYIEAMSYAKPVIGCGVGGIPEVVKDGETGILVPPNDHISLANTIIELLRNESKRKEMGFMARELVENNFSRELMAERTEEAYYSVLK